MFKHTVKYTDYNGIDREKDIYFNVSMPELMSIERSVPGGYSTYIDRVSHEKDAEEIWNTFVEIIDFSYGEKSPDGERFIKRDVDGRKLVDAFKETPVFEAFMYEILTDVDLATSMVNGMLPQKMLQSMQEKAASVQKQQ